uniref:Uncharacterized protein n=1 Tax=Fagus sylvatica TaxID=28930 RepID=A0A2N9HNC7_FAGSY
MAEEASKLRGLEARVAALETKFNFLLQFIRRWTEREEEKKKATISKRQKEIYPALSLSKAAQTLPTPRRPAFHIPRPSRTEPRQFQPLPIPVLQLYTLLIKKKMITPVNQRTRIGPQPKDYNKDLTCEYHQGEVGHTVENCRVLRHRIQDLLDQGVLKFRIEGVINTIGAEKDEEVDITSTKIPWEPLFHELKKRGLLPAPRAPKESTEAGTCQYHPGARDHNLQGCEEFKKEVAGLITKGLIRRRGEQPERDCMTIDQLRLSPYEKTNFQARMERIEEDFEKFCERKKEELGKLTPATPLEMSGPDPVVIRYATKEKVVLQTASVSAVQSSEKVPSVPKPKTKEEVVGNLTSGLGGITRSGRCYTPEELEKRRKEAGKAVEDPTKTKATEEEAADFLRIIKSSEYSIVKQLSKMPSHISKDITGPSFENMVTSILVTNQLTFSDDELPPEGRGHTKALYISVKTNDRIVSRGTDRQWGRPWLHTAGAVPSSLHQKMKLIIGNQLVTILAEEPISIYNDGEIPYIDGCAPEEASFHSFEFVTVIHRVAAVEPRLSKAGIMVAKEFVKAGFQPGQGLGYANQGRTTIVTLEGNKDRYGLGYTPTRRDRQMAYEARRQRAAAKLKGEKWPERKMAIPHIRATFPASAMFQVDEGDVDELALLFTEDLNVNAITTEGDSAAFPVHADQHEEIDLEDFLDEENLKGYRIDEETLDEDTWEDDDLPDLLPHLDGSTRARHPGIRDILRAWRPGISSTELKNLACWGDLARAFLDRYRHNIKAPPPNLITTAVAEEEYAGPMVEGLSIHTIALERRIPPPHHRPATANREKKSRRGLAYHCYSVSRVVMSKRITRKTSNDPHVSKIDNKTDCSLDNIDNSDEEIELPSDILEALERQDEGSKPNIEELEIVNLANEGEEPREVKIGTRCAAEQKEALIALLREFHENLRLVLPRHARPRHRHSGPQDSAESQNASPSKQALRPDEARSHFEDQGRGGKAIEGRFPKHSNLFGLGSQYSPGAEKGRKSQNNAGATYQRAMVTLFHDMIHHEIEVYVDDMIAKSRTAQDHLTDLRKLVPATEEVSAQIEPEQVKDVKIKWTEDCQKAFDKIKEYLLNPPILVPPTPGRPLILYLTVQEASMGCMLGQQDETGKKEQAIYYLSKKFTEPETRYLLVEKTCCALAWASKKLRQYMLYYTTWLVSRMDPNQAIKGQAIADYLADYPSEQLELMDSEFPDEDVMTVDEDNHGRWKLYFDGAANAVGSGIGAVLVSPKGQQTPIAVKLGFDCTNNMTEYEACIVGLQAALGIRSSMSPSHTPQELTITFADALATLASLIKLVEGDDVRPLRIETRDIPAYCVCIEECMNVEAEIDDKPWYYDIKRFIQDREYPSTGEPKMRRNAEEANRLIPRDARGINGSPCQRTLPGPEDHESWLLLVDNGEGLHQTCPDVPQMPDVSEQQERTSPISSHYGLAVAILSLGNGCDRHVPSRMSLKSQVTRFVKNNIICRYGMPEMLITDNASNLNNRMMDQLCQQFKIQHHNSAPYRPKMNGAVEAANKNVKKILSKMTETYKGLARAPALCLVCLPNVSEDIRWSHPLLSGMKRDWRHYATDSSTRGRIERAYNKKARPRTFQPGDLVLKKRNMALSDPRGKFAPSYEGPYVVKKAFSGGAIILADMDGEEFRSPINSDSVIKYHV